jgi:hypothetical protein
MYTKDDWLKRLALGTIGGVVGTLAIQALLSARQQWLPSTMPPIRQDPGELMVKKGEDALPEPARQRIPEVVETAAARMLAAGYGMSFGALYTLFRPTGGPLLVDGILLGVAAWATGYLGWLPALRLMPPIWRQRAPQAMVPIAEHVLYGMATVATYDWLLRRSDAGGTGRRSLL